MRQHHERRNFPLILDLPAYYSETWSEPNERTSLMLSTNMPQLAEQLNQLGLVTLRDVNGQVILMVPGDVDIQQVLGDLPEQAGPQSTTG